MELWRKIPSFLWPGRQNFQKIKDEPLKITLLYLFLGILLFTVLNMLFNIEYLSNYPPEYIAYMVVVSMLVIVILLFLVSSVAYAVAKLLGTDGTYRDMVRVTVYSFTPAYLFGWIPSIGFIGVALSFGNIFAGVVSIFKLSVWRSIAVAAAPLLVLFLLFVALVLFLFQSPAV